MNLESARHNMIEQQIRPWEVLDQRVLDLFEQVPRELFVPVEYREMAFTDMNIPLTHGQVMMSPKVEARMLQALQIQTNESVLEIGTGSGYVTALLSRLARHVYSVDIEPDFVDAAREKLAQVSFVNVSLQQADAANGWDQQSPYDVIVVTGSLPVLPDSLQNSLNLGGRLFAIVGDSPVMEAMLITRLGLDEFQTETLFETDLPPLRHALQPNRFVL